MNRQYLLKQRPTGLPTREDFELVETELPEPQEGQISVAAEYLSLDPAMRGWMNDVPSYIPPVGLGEVMRAGGVGRVTASNAEGFAVGDDVSGMLNIQEQATLDARGAIKIDTSLAPATTYLAALGMTGLTAYFGLIDVGEVKDGDTVVVSGAAGAVGTVVGQIAKIKGARVVGIAGGPEKCAFVVDELGFDACVDYKAEDFAKQLRAATPDRVNVYFDNVGGEILDLVLGRIAMKARVVICGAISGYNADEVYAPKNYLALLVFGARMEGFVVFYYAHKYAEATAQLAQWYAEGKIKSTEHVVEGGIDAFPDELLTLFAGGNTGKLILKV